MLAVAFPAALLCQIGDLICSAIRAANVAVRPSGSNQMTLASIEIREISDRLFKASDLFHVQKITQAVWLVKYLIADSNEGHLSSHFFLLNGFRDMCITCSSTRTFSS